jgi:hypothetical protein
MSDLTTAAETDNEALRAAQPENAAPRSWSERTCPECGRTFQIHLGPGQHQRFCQGRKPDCGTRFRSRCASRGKVIVPLALAWRVGRGKRDTVSAQAHAELITVLDAFATADRKAGRPKMDDYVNTILDTGFRYVDRKRS